MIRNHKFTITDTYSRSNWSLSKTNGDNLMSTKRPNRRFNNSRTKKKEDEVEDQIEKDENAEMNLSPEEPEKKANLDEEEQKAK